MATRAAIYIPIAPQTWARIYSHYDGNPEFMMPALKAHQPNDILAAQEIRSITPEAIDAFKDPRPTVTLGKPYFPGWAAHTYILTSNGWEHAADESALAKITG